MSIKIGFIGTGSFAQHFIELFQVHPMVREVTIAELREDLRRDVANRFRIRQTYATAEELIASDVDAVAIFTQRWTHAPLAIEALRAGKHVYSAVPAAVTLEEMVGLVDATKASGKTYMLGETSYYRPPNIYCRKRFAQGDFGRFVYGEGQYHHDMSHFYSAFARNDGEPWRHFASIPPMLYSTHSLCHVLGVTFSRMSSVSSLGFADRHPDGIFTRELSHWRNCFSNETALFRTADGGMARINEFRRIGAGESRQTIYGTMAAYEEQPGLAILEDLHRVMTENIQIEGRMTEGIWCESRQVAKNPIDGEFDYGKKYLKTAKQRLPHLHPNNRGVEITEENRGNLPRSHIGRFHLGASEEHAVERLPEAFVGLPNGHAGSHQFLVQDFLEAVAREMLPPNHVWQAARYNAPGIVAHESSKKEGERLPIPDFGRPPAGAACIDPLHVLRD
ncbi:MAG TPA: Gfo/Idh/MocA family oxidoreductase [Opitutaceae bacterium]|nr:Gfo/Idh/MocA family oxidoreductase [Opitutaceae bacterium]